MIHQTAWEVSSAMLSAVGGSGDLGSLVIMTGRKSLASCRAAQWNRRCCDFVSQRQLGLSPARTPSAIESLLTMQLAFLLTMGPPAERPTVTVTSNRLHPRNAPPSLSRRTDSTRVTPHRHCHVEPTPPVVQPSVVVTSNRPKGPEIAEVDGTGRSAKRAPLGRPWLTWTYMALLDILLQSRLFEQNARFEQRSATQGNVGPACPLQLARKALS